MKVKDKKIVHNKLSQEDVIVQFKEVHGEDFDYSKVVYVGTNIPVKVYCKKHDFIFTPTPKNHKNGSKCYYCGREAQIEKAKKDYNLFSKQMFDLYGDNYDFSEINYVNTKTEIEAVCKKHGKFNRKPCDLVQGLGCKKCKAQKSKYNDKNTFIEQDKKIFGDITDYLEVGEISAVTKVNLRCNVHNYNFTLSVSARLAGQKCPECSIEKYRLLRRKTTKQYILQAREVHGDNCDYTNTVYTGVINKIKVKCNKHNINFNIFPANHLTGTRCRKCASENISESLKGKEGTGGYTRTGYVNQANGRIAQVYLIKCYNEEEEFYKIGKTFLNINSRFTKSNLCYNFKQLYSIYGEAGYIYDLEVSLHKKYKIYKHKPQKWFAGHTECFTTTLPIEEIEKLNNKCNE